MPTASSCLLLGGVNPWMRGTSAERIETAEETIRPLDHRTEALLALAIVTPVIATYGAIASGLYLAASVL